MVLEFLSNGEGLDCFSRYVLPKLSKVTELSIVSKKNRDSFDLPKVSKMNISSELLKVAESPI